LIVIGVYKVCAIFWAHPVCYLQADCLETGISSACLPKRHFDVIGSNVVTGF